MSARLDWTKAKKPRPRASANTVWTDDNLARRARHALSKWKKTLPRRQRRRLEAVL